MVNLGSYYCTYDWYDFEDIQPVFYRARSEVMKTLELVKIPKEHYDWHLWHVWYVLD